MRKNLLAGVLLAGTLSGCEAGAHKKDKQKEKATATVPAPDAKKKAATLAEKVKTSKKSDGLLTIYQDTLTGSVQLFIKKDQLGKEYIYQSFSISGPTSLYLNQSMHRSTFAFKIQKSFDKLEFIRINNSFYYDSTNAISKTKNVDKPQAVFTSERISGEDSTGYLINGDALFLSEKMDPVKPVTQPGLFT